MLTENAASVQYFKSFLLRKQKSVVSESIFTIKKKKSWSFVTFILDLVVRHSVNQRDKRHLTRFLYFHFPFGEDDQSRALLYSWEAHLWYWIVSEPLNIKIKRSWVVITL